LNQKRYRQTSKKKAKALAIRAKDELMWQPSFLRHVRFVVRTIDRKQMTITETQALLVSLLKKWRQHSLPKWPHTGKIPDG
jgi:hypothetical protein